MGLDLGADLFANLMSFICIRYLEAIQQQHSRNKWVVPWRLTTNNDITAPGSYLQRALLRLLGDLNLPEASLEPHYLELESNY